jgi:hypothetical protein
MFFLFHLDLTMAAGVRTLIVENTNSQAQECPEAIA